ncbi:MAG: DEAD/DEAH box helicase, partial [Niabella sp.]
MILWTMCMTYTLFSSSSLASSPSRSSSSMAHAGEHKDTTFLKTEIKTIHRLTPAHARGLALLGLHAIEDVLRYTPARYINYNEATTSNTLIDGQVATVYGKLEKVKVRKSWRTKVNMTEACLSDITGQIKLVWFNQPFIGKMYPEGTLVRISGKVTNGQFLNPLIDKVSNLPDTTQSLFFSPPEGNEKTRQANYVPVYRETKGVSSLFLNELVKKIVHLPAFKSIDDPLPLHIRQELSLPNLRESIVYAHIPRDDKDILAAQKRFLFEEMFTIQLRIETERAKAKQSISYTIGDVDMDRFFKLHNFTPTSAQKRALDAILGDLQRSKKQGNRKQDSNAQSYPMQRLLEGDVGSGKTLVAAAASYAVILEKRDQKQFGTPLQVAYLAPTEVLAYQQFEGFIKFLSHTGIEIGYLSGTKALKFPSKTNPNEATKVSRAQLLKWVKEGRISMLIGTHAITKKSV